MAQLTTNCRPAKTPIHAVTFDDRVKRQLCLNRAVTAHLMEESEDPEQRIEEAFELLKQKGVLNPDDRVVLVSDVITVAGIDSIQLRQIA